MPGTRTLKALSQTCEWDHEPACQEKAPGCTNRLPPQNEWRCVSICYLCSTLWVVIWQELSLQLLQSHGIQEHKPPGLQSQVLKGVPRSAATKTGVPDVGKNPPPRDTDTVGHSRGAGGEMVSSRAFIPGRFPTGSYPSDGHFKTNKSISFTFSLHTFQTAAPTLVLGEVSLHMGPPSAGFQFTTAFSVS